MVTDRLSDSSVRCLCGILQCEKPEIEHGFCVIDHNCMYIFIGGFLAFIRTVERKQES